MGKPEILAPAGSREALTAAVRCGANAVYLGGKSLSARQNARNFDPDELKEAVDYCHLRDVKVYRTLNTLGTDSQQPLLQQAAQEALTAGVDAGNVYVTAFPNFAIYKKFSQDLAWETEVWIADAPEHLIHLNGDRFMGPR